MIKILGGFIAALFIAEPAVAQTADALVKHIMSSPAFMSARHGGGGGHDSQWHRGPHPLKGDWTDVDKASSVKSTQVVLGAVLAAAGTR